MHKKTHIHRPSPLDDAMVQLLGLLDGRSSGTFGTRDLIDLANAMEVPAPFVQGLFLSARRRGLVAPESAGRGKVTWKLTAIGSKLLAQDSMPSDERAGITISAD